MIIQIHFIFPSRISAFYWRNNAVFIQLRVQQVYNTFFDEMDNPIFFCLRCLPLSKRPKSTLPCPDIPSARSAQSAMRRWIIIDDEPTLFCLIVSSLIYFDFVSEFLQKNISGLKFRNSSLPVLKLLLKSFPTQYSTANTYTIQKPYSLFIIYLFTY